MVRFCEAEHRYLEMAVEKACEMFANQDLKDAPTKTIKVQGTYAHVGHEEDFTSSLQLQNVSLNSSIDGYLVSLRHLPSSVPSGGGSARLRDTEEDPASTYLNLDAMPGDDSNGVEEELP
ncbi:hypothetical protein Acr_23g0007580 [Actinidia rufa]|uniref:Uncharacterized protein n=1 Tax=Actinidia rufa TaxID=165716 RepID=A0A7J0GNM7_9ERIC|nr:hypothetical protein Acr_23g0007580 [Actinidia rufa]